MTTYHQQLHPWCIVCCLPNAQTLIVTRLRRRNDAEAHQQVLCRLQPSAQYPIVFDPAIDNPKAFDQSTNSS